jgi:hypothetical protein
MAVSVIVGSVSCQSLELARDVFEALVELIQLPEAYRVAAPF